MSAKTLSCDAAYHAVICQKKMSHTSSGWQSIFAKTNLSYSKGSKLLYFSDFKEIFSQYSTVKRKCVRYENIS